MKFTGTESYVATPDLMMAVNAAVTLARPLLVKGEPGTGKTLLAIEVAKALKKPLFEWHIKSTTKAMHGLYEYDAVSRLRDSQLGDDRVYDIKNYIQRGMLWEAFAAPEQLRGEAVDARADVYALGVVIRELGGPAADAWNLAPLLTRMTAQERGERPAGMREVLGAMGE